MSGEKTHSSLGPSSAARWMNCPGSIGLIAACPPSPPSEHAAEGTVAHGLCEELCTGKSDHLKLMGRIGQEVKCDGFDIEITEEMVDAVIEYHDVIREDLKALGRLSGTAPTHSRFEVRLNAPGIDPGLWGTADALVFKRGAKLLVYDFKYGKGVAVEAEENEQLATYAVMAAETVAGWAFDEFEFVIVQPRARHADGSVRRWTASKEWLEVFQQDLRRAIEETRKPGAAVVAGDWCRFCPAKASCPAMLDAVQAQAQLDFSMVPVPQGKGILTGLPAPGLMSIEKLSAALAWEDAINSWYEALRERAFGMLSNGEAVPGFKLVEGKSNRLWTSEDAVVARFEPLLGRDKLFETKLLSPAKLEKIVGKGKVDDLTFKKEAKKTIAKDSDPRREAVSSAAQDFEAVPQAGKAISAEPEDPLADPLASDDLKRELMGARRERAKREPLWPA